MKKIAKPMMKKSYRPNLLATSIAAVCTAMVASSVTQASDIEIYQEAKTGTITLLFVLDNSGSMAGKDSTGITRTERVRNGMIDVLAGSSDAAAIADDKIIGLSTFASSSSGKIVVPARALNATISGGGSYTAKKPAYIQYTNASNQTRYKTCGGYSAYSTCTAWNAEQTNKPSGSYSSVACENINGKTCTLYYTGTTVNVTNQRTLLLKELTNWSGSYNTPTAEAYAEAAAYMLGTNTGNIWYKCNGTTDKNACTTVIGEPSASTLSSYSTTTSYPYVYYYIPSNSKNYYYYRKLVSSGFNDSVDSAKIADGSKYKSPLSTDNAECSGRGIYFLTDGEPNSSDNNSGIEIAMKGALSSTYSGNLTGSGTLFNGTGANYSVHGWEYISDLSQLLLNQTVGNGSVADGVKMNPFGLPIKTAVVGFGDSYGTIPSYDSKLTQTENLKKITGLTLANPTIAQIKAALNTDSKKAAAWGVYGQGGWYKGSSSADVVSSVNNFINALSTEIPSVTTGSPAIPRDALNPSTLQNDAYYPQFQPTPDKAAKLWLGNLKKYLVSSTGALKDKNSNNIIDSKGRIIDNYDYWSPAVDASVKDADENTYGSIKYAQQGGAWSQLKLRTATDGTVQRKLLTNRVGTGTGGSATFSSSNNTLRTVNLDYLTDTTYRDDPNRGYLISLLGYAVDAANPSTITTSSLTTASELRQIGAVMHSTPILVTNKGKVGYDVSTKKVTSSNREDYVLFGTTQGLLHVVDAKTGEEKFAFVPNEMVERQKQAFLTSTATNGGMSNLFYGIDGAWTLHTEYVIDASGNLITGTGKGGLKGKQLAVGGLRMGGRSYYGLDLSNINSPALKFNINPSGTCSNSNPLGCMGESWSKPNLGYVNWGGKRTLVMFVGGGYDAGYESDTYNQTDSKKGAGVFMFRVEDETGGGTGKAGDLLWWANANATNGLTGNRVGTNDANLKYSVVSEIRTVDRDGDDLIDHLYFGDLGGQLFRIDLNNKAATIGDFAKRVQRIIDLNTAAAVDKRPRFYDMPAFSLYSENGSTFAVVSIGSGNRSSPLKDYATGTTGYDHDAIYNVYDKDVARKDLYNTLPTTGATALKTSSVTKAEMGEVTNSNRNSQTTLVAPYSGKGWYYKFQSSKLQSEKVFGTPLALNYQLYASTFDGSKDGISGDCGAGVKGESFLNRFCMPYGQCKTENAGSNAANCVGTKCDKISLGAGIHTAVVRGDDTPPTTPNPNDPKVKNDGTSAGNYCLSTGGRTAYTPLGGGSGEQTQICLIPQRWYERLQ